MTTEDRLQAWRIKLGQIIGMFPDATIYASPLPDSTDNADVVQTPTGPEAGAPSNSSVALCYFDGDFGRPRGDPPSSVPDASRLVVIVRDRSWDIAAMGFADQLAIVDPNR